MGRLSSFEICFDNPHGNFHSGSYIEGNVAIALSAPMKMRGVYIKFKGKAEVKWTETESNDRESYNRNYAAKEKYFENNILLFGNPSSQCYNSVELASGHHDLPFRFHLPQGLPSSFEAEEGQVRYTATAKIIRQDKEDRETKRRFTVISVVDLNQKHEYRCGLSGSNQKNLCCCCCKSGPISALFYIERHGWVPGEAIRLYADIKNGASRTIDQSSVDLTMETIFYATGHSKHVSKQVAHVTRPPIQGLSEDSWRGELLFIPSLPPTHLGGCNIIDVQYTLTLTVDPSGPSLDLKVPLSIVIGTIPLTVMNQPGPIGHASAPPTFSHRAPSAPYSDFHNPPPPSYSQCVAGGYTSESNEKTLLNSGRCFTPSYTFYHNWGDSTSTAPVCEPKT